MKAHRERGAAMVEFALIAPVIVLLVLGLIEYGIRFSRQAEFNNAAFVAARSIATHQSDGQAKSNAAAAINGGLPSGASFASTGPCPSSGGPTTQDVKVTIVTSMNSPTGFFGGSTYTLTARGVARCGG